MPRKARIVIPGIPHHITQRGNNKQKVFRDDEDRRQYLDFFTYYCDEYDLNIWAYCLMENHVHFIGVPEEKESMASVFQIAHMRYTQYFNTKYERVGHLWQSRYYSSPLDEKHTFAAVRYVETNPVRAGEVEKPESYTWSSAGSRIKGFDDPVLRGKCWLERKIKDWRTYLSQAQEDETIDRIRKRTYNGLPAGDNEFIYTIEQQIGRIARPGKRGRPKKSDK